MGGGAALPPLTAAETGTSQQTNKNGFESLFVIQPRK